MASVLITGGRGFAGSAIARRLRDAGQRVIGYNRTFSQDEDGVIMAQGELADVSRLVRVLQGYDVTAIVHTAAMSHPTFSLDFPLGTFAANVEGTVAVYEAARLAGVQRVVNFSSETVYGATSGPLTEDTPVKPSTPYAVTKVTTEWLGEVYRDRYGLDVLSLRIAQVYGPGDRMPEVLGDMLKALIRTGVFELAHGADHWFNFIHVQDVALATERALRAPGPFTLRAYNISSAEYWRLGDVVEQVRPLFPHGRICLGRGPVAELDLQGPFDIAAARTALGYEPAWSLADGLRDYATWLTTHDP